MTSPAPAVLWLHRELRLRDNPALVAASSGGRPVLAVFVLDDETPGPWRTGGAQRWWLHHSLAALQAALGDLGVPLLLRRGVVAEVLAAVMHETGASELHAGQPTEPWARRAASDLQTRLGERLHLHRTTTLFEMEAIRTQTGGPYHVFTPFSRACLARGTPEPPLPVPPDLTGATPLSGDRLEEWGLLPTHPDWAGGFRDMWVPGETGAADRLRHVVDEVVAEYDRTRNLPGQDGTSMLSAYLHWGELSPGQVWHAVGRAGKSEGARVYRNELLWREFSAHLLWHHPDLPEAPLRPEYSAMPWRRDADALRAWQRGRTGVPIVDAGMRQLWHTGWMHNRVRMIVASFLVKHLLIPWQDGEAWFWDTLVDADLASNAAQWQWIAGCGADAAPFFRIFNPVLQGRKFDPDGVYVRRWLKNLADVPDRFVHAPWENPNGSGPPPIVDLASARTRALDAFKQIRIAAA